MFERVLAARMNGNEGPRPHRNAESSGRELLRAVDTLWHALAHDCQRHAHALIISARHATNTTQARPLSCAMLDARTRARTHTRCTHAPAARPSWLPPRRRAASPSLAAMTIGPRTRLGAAQPAKQGRSRVRVCGASHGAPGDSRRPSRGPTTSRNEKEKQDALRPNAHALLCCRGVGRGVGGQG